MDSPCDWVDYLPEDTKKRASLDTTETFMSNVSEEGNDGDEMMVDWPEESSLEDVMLPPAILLEHDPMVQHELFLEDTASLDETPQNMDNYLAERRAQLAASMQKSRESRRYLEQHIQQRANLASVLKQIEKSSQQVDVHLLLEDTNIDDADLEADEHILNLTSVVSDSIS